VCSSDLRYDGELGIHLTQTNALRPFLSNPNASTHLNLKIGEYCYCDVVAVKVPRGKENTVVIRCEATGTSFLVPSNFQIEQKTQGRTKKLWYITPNGNKVGTIQEVQQWCAHNVRMARNSNKSNRPTKNHSVATFQWDACVRGKTQLVLQSRFNDVGSKRLCDHLYQLNQVYTTSPLQTTLPIFLQLYDRMKQLNAMELTDVVDTANELHEDQQQRVPMTVSQSKILNSVLTHHVQGVMGPPGSGKTYFSAVLRRRKERRSVVQMAEGTGKIETGNRSAKVVPQHYVADQKKRNELNELKSWGN
jgi:hypothetical protein